MPLLANVPTVALSSSAYLSAQVILELLFRSKGFNTRDAVLSASKLVGACHALTAGGLALKEVLDKKWQGVDLIRTKSSIGDHVVAIEAGYLLQGKQRSCHIAFADRQTRCSCY